MPDRQKHIRQLQEACPQLKPEVVQDFVDRMDTEYFEHFTPTVIIKHLTLASSLTPDLPCAIDINTQSSKTFQLTIVSYDYFSEFAALCGLLSSAGLDIRNAVIYTFAERRASSDHTSSFVRRQSPIRHWPTRPAKQPLGLFRKKVVDVFNVQLLSGCAFGPTQQTQFKQSVQDMLQLLDARHFREVRRHVNRALVETLGKIKSHVSDIVHPVEIQFDNERLLDATAMDIRSTDTPAFLYTFANALTMQGVYISKAKIEVRGHTVHNEFYVRGRTGGKINDVKEQQELTSTAALIKEFSHYLTWAPDPGKALDHFDQLLDELHNSHKQSFAFSLLQQKPLLGHLAKLFGSSDFLWEDLLRRQHANLLPAMVKFQEGSIIRKKSELTRTLNSQLKRYKVIDDRKTCLNTFKDQELFRIDMKHMLTKTSLQDFSQALTNLAEVILEQALQEAQIVMAHQLGISTKDLLRIYSFAIFGLGKLGGAELGYASDIEVLFVYTINKSSHAFKQPVSSDLFEQLVQEILRWIEAKHEGIFHIDTRLRPYGEKGLLSNSFDEIVNYYAPKGPAAPFERQALIKLRHIAGDRKLGEKVEGHREQFVYSREPWPLDIALHLRNRQINELIPAKSIHVKYSPGGLIDIEYLVQYLQLIHGHRLRSLRTPNTLKALKTLQQRKILQQKEEKVLHDDYLFFRHLIDALRIVRGHAQDLILPKPGSDSLIFLARRLGFITKNWNDGAVALEKETQRRMKRIHKIFRQHFHS